MNPRTRDAEAEGVEGQCIRCAPGIAGDGYQAAASVKARVP